MRLRQEADRILNVQNIEEHGEAHGASGQAAAVRDEIALFHDDVMQTTPCDASGGGHYHLRINVERIHRAGYPLRDGDRERAVAAAELDGVAANGTAAKRLQNTCGNPKQAVANDGFVASGIANKHRFDQ